MNETFTWSFEDPQFLDDMGFVMFFKIDLPNNTTAAHVMGEISIYQHFILQSLFWNKNPEHIPVQCIVANIRALKIQFVAFLIWH